MRRAVWCRSRASRPPLEFWFEYIPLLRGARRRRCLIDLCLLDFFLYLGGAAATGVARFPVSVTVLGLVGRPPDAGRFSDDRARWLSCRSLGVGGVVRGVFSGNAHECASVLQMLAHPTLRLERVGFVLAAGAVSSASNVFIAAQRAPASACLAEPYRRRAAVGAEHS